MAGRPKRVFTPEEIAGIERYARIGSYNRTISTGLNIPLNSLERHFGAKIRHWRAAGKLDMRESLHKQRDTSPQTAIFIAKNELGMTDKLQTDQVQEKTIPQTPEQLREVKEVCDELSRRRRIKLIKASESGSKAETA